MNLVSKTVSKRDSFRAIFGAEHVVAVPLQYRNRQSTHFLLIFHNKNSFVTADVGLDLRLEPRNGFIGSRQVDLKSRAGVGFTVHPNPSIALPYHAVNRGQAEAGSGTDRLGSKERL